MALTLAIESVTVVSGFAAALVAAWFIEAKGVLVASIRSNITFVNIDTSWLRLTLFVKVFIPAFFEDSLD